MNHHTCKQILNYNFDLDVLGCKSFSFIANPIFPAIFNFPWKKAYKIETKQIETIRKIMSPHALNICLNAEICACVFRCVSFQVKEKNVPINYLLRVQFSGHELHEVCVIHCDCNITFSYNKKYFGVLTFDLFEIVQSFFRIS